MNSFDVCRCTEVPTRHLSPPSVVTSGERGQFDPADPGGLIPLMQATQEEFGYLPRSEVARIADYLGLSEARVYGVATFYNQFRLEPLGKNYVQICTGTACHVKGAAEIHSVLRAELGLEGESTTTRDGLFTLDTVACLGACSMAPLVNVNDEFHGHMTPQKALKLIRGLRSKEREAR
ncbi:MAG: NAD(P)H-dependent oxidoreductase subunit E [Bacillota bacterium]